MAEVAHNPSRRGILGALAFAPALATMPAIAALPASASDFNACVQRLEAAKRDYLAATARLNDAQGLFFANSPKQPRGGLVLAAKGRAFTMDEAVTNMNAEHHAWQEAVRACRDKCDVDRAEECANAALSAEANSVDALLACAAPDLRAVAKKIEVAIDYGCDIEELEPIFADLRRMGGGA